MRIQWSTALLLLTTLACTPAATQKTPGSSEKSPVGGACREDGDCVAGFSCDKDDPGGECTKKCATNADCGDHAVCTPEKECLQACASNDDCKRSGYQCGGKAPDKFCDIPEAAEHK